MTLNMYAIKDELNKFTPPVPFPNDQIAIRYFKEQLAENITMKMEPKDFSIWKICEYDSETGKITNNDVELLQRG